VFATSLDHEENETKSTEDASAWRKAQTHAPSRSPRHLSPISAPALDGLIFKSAGCLQWLIRVVLHDEVRRDACTAGGDSYSAGHQMPKYGRHDI